MEMPTHFFHGIFVPTSQSLETVLLMDKVTGGGSENSIKKINLEDHIFSRLIQVKTSSSKTSMPETAPNSTLTSMISKMSLLET